MKNHWRCRSPILICAFVIAASTFATPGLVHAQDNTKPNTGQDSLTQAQTRYYEAQAAKLEQDRSLSQRIINLSAFLAAVVAVLSLVLNYSSTLRTQRDSQFLEALKRFGDKDSPSVRASAAGLLAKLSEQKGIIFRSRRPNFEIVLDQLMAGLLLENNSVCVASIIDAVRHLTTARPLLVLQRIRVANLRLQTDLIEALAKFLATTTLDEQSALSPGAHWSEAASSTPYSDHVLITLALRSEDAFRKACRSAIQEFKLRSPDAQKQMLAKSQKEVSLLARRLSLNVQLCTELLKLPAGKRTPGVGRTDLREIFLVNAHLYFADLTKIDFGHAQLQSTTLWQSSLQGTHFDGANLQLADLNNSDLQGGRLLETRLEGASLFRANLQNANLLSAYLQPLELKSINGNVDSKRTDLQEANFEGAQLAWADLRCTEATDANFKGANLENARLQGMNVDDYRNRPANFENSNWWKANFLDGELSWEGNNDNTLLEFLFGRYGGEVPKDTSKLNPSVQKFVNQKPPPPGNADKSGPMT